MRVVQALASCLRASFTPVSIAAVTPLAMAVPAHASNDLRYAYPDQMSVSPAGVNLQTGRFTHSKTDVVIGPLRFVRSWAEFVPAAHNSNIMGKYYTGLVTGWTHNFVQGVQFVQNSTSEYDVFIDSKRYRYTSSGGTFLPWNKTALGTLLTQDAGAYYLTDERGANFVFSKSLPANAPISAVYADGSRLDYSYNGSGKLISVKSSLGYILNLEYDGYGNVSAACGFNTATDFVASGTCAGATLKASYGYTSGGSQLASVTDVRGGVVQITGSAPTCITLPNSSTCEVQNFYGTQPGESFQTPPDIVRKQVMADGKTWLYSYNLGEDPLDVPIVPGRPRWSRSWMTAPDGKVTSLRYDRGVLVQLATPSNTTEYRYENETVNANWITFDYHAVMPSLVTQDEGNREYFLYSTTGQVIQKSSWPKNAPHPTLVGGGDMISRTDAELALCCTTPGVANIPAGAVTYGQAFLPSYPVGHVKPTGCGSGPADAKRCNKPIAQIDANGNQTDFTYDPAHGGVLTETGPAVNGVRPQTRYAYVQRQAWIKTGSGSYVATGQPVWLLASKSICKTSAATGNPAWPCSAGAGDEVRTLYDYGPDSGPNNLLLRGVVDDATGEALRTCYSYDWRGNKVSETKPKGTTALATCP